MTGRITRALIVPLALVVLIVGVLLLRAILFPTPFAPFDFPLQHVENPMPPGATVPTAHFAEAAKAVYPTVHFGEDLEVASVRCNTTNKPVTAVGSRQWQSVDPAGSFVVDVAVGSHTFLPGCETRHFSNPVPAAVWERTRQLIAQGHPLVLWRVTGQSTPTSTRQRVVTGVWTTDTFALVP